MSEGIASKRDTFLLIASFVIPLTALLLWHTAQFYPFFSDDALISLQYAKRLIAGQGLTWTAGVPVEGYSNLLWILLISMTGLLGADLIDAARFLGLLSTTLVPIVILWMSPSKRPTAFMITASLLVFIPLNVTVATWAIGGLEMPILSLLLCSAALMLRREYEFGFSTTHGLLPPSLLLGLVAITRPDGFLFTAAFSLALSILWFIRRRLFRFRNIVFLFALPLIFVLAQLLFRLWYYGDWLPNPAYVKIAFTTARWTQGWEYLFSAFRAQSYFWLPVAGALIATLIAPLTRDRAILFGLPLVLWLLYVTVEGGDFCPSFRLMLPAIVLGTLILIDAALLAMDKFPKRRRRVLLMISAVFLFALVFPLHYLRQHAAIDTRRAIEERWEWDGKILGELLCDAFHRQQPLLAVTAAGCLPYWSELPAIDMFGLNDRHIARARPTNFGIGAIGHELGDPRYLLGRKPDMIILNAGERRALYPRYTDTMQTIQFSLLYLPVALQDSRKTDQRFVVWMRRESARIGIRKWTDSLRIPGYYLQMDQKSITNDDIKFDSAAPAFLDKRNVLVQPIIPGQRLGYDLPIPGLASAQITVRGKGAEQVECIIDDGRLTLECSRGEAAIEDVVLHWSPEKTDTH